MLTTLLLSLALGGAPLAFTDGELLGWTEDGNELVWTTTIDFAQDPKDPRTARLATVRNVVTANEETYELERWPLRGKGPGTPLPDAARFDAWRQAHPLVKRATLAGVEAGARVGGKATRAWGGNGRAVAPELFTSRLGVTRSGKSMVAEYDRKAVAATRASWWIDPTGRRVVFELAMAPRKGERALTELVEVAAGPTAFLYAADASAFQALSGRVEAAGFVVQGWDESPRKRPGVVVYAAPANLAAAQAVARALSGKAESRAVPRSLGELVVTAEVAPP